MLYENNSKLKQLSRNLRRKQTDAERLLWSKLRGRQLENCKFYRQYAIDRYILDFYCQEKKLAVELDGSQHLKQLLYDQTRTKFLERMGIIVIRFWDNEALTNIDGVLKVIASQLNSKNKSTHLNPLFKREEDQGTIY